ncbi:MAG: hypothetical protein M3Y84_06965, partial [Acidobacteriota bacterium]|nr:hypothetical protein [Acidobacteriota bacterium]
TTGDLELGIAAAFDMRSGQAYSFNVTFVVVLTASNLARFTNVAGSCAGTRNCRIIKSLPSAIPTGMRYIGLATYNWHLGSHSGPLVLNTLSGHQDGLTVSPPSVNVEYLCTLQNAKGRNKMFCEWGAKVVAFDPTEMEQNNSTIFPQYTFIGTNTPNRQSWVEHTKSLSGGPIQGHMDAFEGLSLFYNPGIQHRVWWIESFASNFSTAPPDTALTTHGILLGTTFGNSTTASNYSFQESRAVGLLR